MAPKRRTGSKGAKTKHPTAGPRKVSRAELRSQYALNRSLVGLRLLRRGKMSLAAAAREAGTTPRTMQRYVGSALKKGKGGRYEATKTDRLPRICPVPTPRGTIHVLIRSWTTASRLGRYHAAIQHFLHTGDTRALRPFRGKSFKTGKVTYPFITDPRTLERLANAGELSFEDFYALTTGESK